MYTYTQGCHGCGGKGWVSPPYGSAVVCPVCGGSGVARKPSTAVSGAPYTQPYISAPNIPSIPFGKCPNAMSGVCFCTGACRSSEDNWTEWKKYFNAKDDDNNGTSED